MKKLLKICNKKTRLILGIMSGTSHDGVDVALAKISNGKQANKPLIKLLHYNSYPYPPKIKETIANAFTGTTSQICRLNFVLGEIFAKAALRLIKEAKFSPAAIDLIASHGQTIYHIPPSATNTSGATLQIGESSVIAAKTGVITISDFRGKDMAFGGHGAPLVPLADYLLFHEARKVKAVQNIGGIANVTVVTPNINNVKAFDTGPGNALIDEAVKIATQGKQTYDHNGKFAKRGKINLVWLNTLMQHPYFRQKPPKSTGRELFGTEMVHHLIIKYKITNRNFSDLIATLTRFTAETIYLAYQKFIIPFYSLKEVIFTGGGIKNPVLMEHLHTLFGEKENAALKLTNIDVYGIPTEAKEALSFAIIANATINGTAGNIPSATGAKQSTVLGKITTV